MAYATPVFILVSPQLPENIGMVARAMANFGACALRIVTSEGESFCAHLEPEALRAAAGAAPVLAKAVCFSSLEDAISDLRRVYAATARQRRQIKPIIAPHDLVRETRQKGIAPEEVGVVFGPERTGLTNDDVALADAVLTIDAAPEFSSLNLAQTVVVVAYAWRSGFFLNESEATVSEIWRPARRETLFSFFSFIESLLDESGFFPEEKRAVMKQNFRNMLHRTQASEQDVRTLRGALRALLRRKRLRTGGR